MDFPPLLMAEDQDDFVKKSTRAHRFSLLLICAFVCFFVAEFFLPAITDLEAEVGVGTKSLWNLLRKVKIRDAKGTPRSWSDFLCLSDQGVTSNAAQCPGNHHPCQIAPLIFKEFQKLYAPNSEPGQAPPHFTHSMFHLDSKFVNYEEKRKPFVQAVIDHMHQCTFAHRRMLWLIEITPGHAFLLEQGSPAPDRFRLYQSWRKGFDINYWLTGFDDEQPCYENHWGSFREFKYHGRRYPDAAIAKEHDMQMLRMARERYGEFRDFDSETVETIFRKLSYGFKMLEGPRLEILKRMEKWETTALDITGESKHLWSLQEVFGLEPISLKSLETDRPLFFGITVQTLDLGSTEEFEQIQVNPSALHEMNELTETEDDPLTNFGDVQPPRDFRLETIDDPPKTSGSSSPRGKDRKTKTTSKRY